jgi:hypothetical protein
MANWLDKIQEVLSIKSIEDQMDKNASLLGEEGSWGNAVGKLVQAPVYGVTKGVGALGGAIGGAAGFAGGAMSEAAQEAWKEGRTADQAKAIAAGIGGGAETGFDEAQKNITALDVASLGAGAGAGLAMRGAGAAATAGSLGKAASLAKTAGALSKADLALSGVDAGLGVNDVVTGVKEGDWAKAAMGVARVAGNSYGAKNAFGDLTKAKGFAEGADQMVEFMGTGGVKKPKPETNVLVSSDPVDLNGKGFYIEKVKEGDQVTTPGLKPDPTWEAKKQIREREADARAAEFLRDPEVQATYADAATIIRQIEGQFQDEFYGKMGRRTDVLKPTGANLPFEPTAALYLQGGEFSGFSLGGEWIGITDMPVDPLKGVKRSYPKGDITTHKTPNTPYRINVPNMAKMVSENYNGFLDPTLNKIDTALEILPESTARKILDVREGRIERTPEIDLEIKGEMMGHALLYTVMHESGGHSAAMARHSNKGTSDYRSLWQGKKGSVVSHTQNVKLPEAGDPLSKPDVFSSFQNEIVNNIRMLETEYPQLHALLTGPNAQAHFRKLYQVGAPVEDPNWLFSTKTKIKADRPVGRAEVKAAEAEFAPQEVSEYQTGKKPESSEMTMTAEETDALDAKNAMTRTAEETDAIDARNLAWTKAPEVDWLNQSPIVKWGGSEWNVNLQPQNGVKKVGGADYVSVRFQPLGDGAGDAHSEWFPVDELHNLKAAQTGRTVTDVQAQNAKIQKEIGRKTKMGAKHGEQTVWERPTPAAEPPRWGKQIDPALADEPLRPLADRIKMAFYEQNKINRINLAKNNEAWHAKMAVQEEAWAKFKNGEISEEELLRRIEESRKGNHGLITETLGMRLTPEEFTSVMRTIQEQTVKNTEERNNLALSWRKMANGERLEPGEVERLRKALRTEIGDHEQTNFWVKMLRAGENLVGGSRALMSSMDLSAAGRQALYASVTNPKETAKAFKAQIDALKMTPKQFETYMKTLSDQIHNPFAELSQAAGLHITGPHQLEGKVEEAFLNPTWAEKIPGVRRTEQAYIAYLNKMRVELFNKGAKTLMDSGIPEFKDTGELSQAYKDLAYMVNTLTGRGEMSLMHISPGSRIGKTMGLAEELAPGEKTMNQMHRALTSVFFAPRFTASRAAILRDSTMAFLGGNLTPEVQKMYMKNVYGTYAAQASVIAALVGTGVATFQADPRKPDFGNLKVGNVRYDVFGGLKQWAKLFTTLGTDRYMSKAYGWRKYGDGVGSKTKSAEVGKFLQGKLSPPAGFLLEALTGEDFLGRKSNMLRNTYGHMFPMILQTVGEVIDAHEADQLAIAVPAAALGIGVNAYAPNRKGGWKR